MQGGGEGDLQGEAAGGEDPHGGLGLRDPVHHPSVKLRLVAARLNFLNIIFQKIFLAGL